MSKILLPETTITTAVTASLSSELRLPPDVANVLVLFDFVYGSGGTTAKAWLQTKVGDEWVDIANWAGTTASEKRIYNLNSGTAVTTIYTPLDGTLADDSSVSGIIGDALRVKYTTTGTYAGSTTLTVTVNMKSLTTDKMNKALVT